MMVTTLLRDPERRPGYSFRPAKPSRQCDWVRCSDQSIQAFRPLPSPSQPLNQSETNKQNNIGSMDLITGKKISEVIER